MKRLARVVVSWALFTQVLLAQETAGLGQWRSYQSHVNGLGFAVRGNVYYKLSDVGLVSWDADANTYKALTRVEGLANARPTSIVYHPDADEIFIGYASGRINRFRSTDQLQVIADITRATQFPARGVRALAAAPGLVVAGTDFGIVGYDYARRETRFSLSQVGTAPAQITVTGLAVYGGRLFALLSTGLYSAPLNAPNIADPAAWRIESGVGGLPTTDLKFLCANDQGILIASGEAIFTSVGTGIWSPYNRTAPVTGALRHLSASGNAVSTVRDTNLIQFYADGATTWFTTSNPTQAAVLPGSRRVLVSDDNEGFLVVENVGQGSASQLFARNNTFPTSDVSGLAAADGRLFIGPNGYVGRFVPNFTNKGALVLNKPVSRAQALNLFNGGLSDTVWQDLGTVCYDLATGRVYYGAWGQGIVVLAPQEDGSYTRVKEYNRYTPGLPGQLPDAQGRPQHIYIGGLALDINGNLWCSSFEAASPLAVRTPEGQWFSYAPLGISRPLHILAARNNYKWVQLADQNLLVYDDRGRPEAQASHRSRILTTATSNGALPSPEVLSLAEDNDGAIWVGTAAGIAVFFNPDNVFSANVNGECPRLEGRCLLQTERIQALAVDAANRKWIGTSTGLYCLSADGTRLVFQFTTLNSPLLSDNVQHLAIDASTGEVYISTDAGLCSYRATPTEGGSGKEIFIYPNPVYSDFSGSIGIRDVPANATVRITTLTGHLLRTLQAEGGQASWDGKDAAGRRLASGVYLVLAANRDGTQAGSAKVAFIQR